ncbi:MAG: hypothetical protein VW268_11505 [Rhodospirillaceae bacterium]
MTTFLIGFLILIAAWLFAQWYANANPTTLKVVLKWFLVVIGVLVLVALVITGRVLWAFAMLPAFLTLLIRARSAVRSAKNFARMAGWPGGGGPGQTSEVKTRFIHMVLDHETGEMNGIIMEGPFRGWALDDLTFEQTVALWRHCGTEDAESQRVLEAYMDRTRPDWRDIAGEQKDSGGSGGANAPSGGMTREQALAILGLKEGASREDINAAYKRIISGLHPDRGGSDYLAAQVNEAKSVLLDS